MESDRFWEVLGTDTDGYPVLGQSETTWTIELKSAAIVTVVIATVAFLLGRKCR